MRTLHVGNPAVPTGNLPFVTVGHSLVLFSPLGAIMGRVGPEGPQTSLSAALYIGGGYKFFLKLIPPPRRSHDHTITATLTYGFATPYPIEFVADSKGGVVRIGGIALRGTGDHRRSHVAEPSHSTKARPEACAGHYRRAAAPAFRHSQGGTGCGSLQSPRFASRASCSRAASTVARRAYR